MGVEVRAPHPRVLCEGGGFDFRPHKPVATKIDSQRSEVFLERAVLTMRNHRQQPQKSKRKQACPCLCFSFNPLAIIGNQIKTPALENRQGRGTQASNDSTTMLPHTLNTDRPDIRIDPASQAELSIQRHYGTSLSVFPAINSMRS